MMTSTYKTPGTHPGIEIYRKNHTDADWSRREVSLDDVRGFQDPSSVLQETFELSLIVAEADKIRECKEWRQVFTQQFRIPEIWWAHALKNSNGYFGHEDTRDETGVLDGCNTWLLALVKQTFEDIPKGKKDYIWYKYNIFTHWIANTRQSIIILFDPKPVVRQRLLCASLYTIDQPRPNDPFWVYAPLLEDLLDLQDQAVWGIRTLVRKTEIHRSSTSGTPQPNFLRLHDIARHAIHVYETLEVNVTTIDMMYMSHEAHQATWATGDTVEKSKYTQLHAKLQFYNHMLRNLRHRSASNKERLNNEIQYAFNTVTQYDSRVTVEIGRAAQADSAAMKTIAFITLTFFPATFVCAIFSMSFFDFDPNTAQWKVSKDFWVYWVVAVPITAITASMWKWWNKLAPEKLIGHDTLTQSSVQMAKIELEKAKARLGTTV